MRLQEIYEKDITRHINPAVVVGELNEEAINQEIEEYVFSNDILKNMYAFLNAFANRKEGKTGVWISGYYGSGKSHFIKYLFYCLNEKTKEKALNRLSEAVIDAKLDPLGDLTPSNFDNLIRELNKKDIEEIIFNIDAVSGNKKNEHTITRILMNQFNAKRGYNTSNIAIAILIEKHLDKLGKFQDFKDKVKEKTGADWEAGKIKDIIRLRRSHIIDIACEIDPGIDKESLTEAIRSDENYTIEELVRELKEYVDTKGPEFRLIYLLDEISQYIGTNSDLLLNLQTIVEEIGHHIGNKVWIACTAQQDLTDLVANTENKTIEFGKILGRFETMISLDSQDVAYITQKRILDKNDKGINALTKLYTDNKGAINNQFVFHHDLYRNYNDAEEFYLAYPFIPYQFRLISDVFLSFSRVGYVGEGVKNTERAILGITHYTANNQKDKEVGYFISFDNFFNEQFSKNLTHEANNILNRAFQIHFDSDIKDFADRVIRVLFMITNLTEDQEVNFPANIENITTLLLNDLNTVKSELQRDVESVLNVLVEKNVVRVSEGKYKFLDDDGVLVANSISSTVVNQSTKLEYFYDSLIRPVLKPDPSISLGNKNVRAKIFADDLMRNQGDDFELRFVIFDTTDIEQQALHILQSSLYININRWLNEDKSFRKDFDEFCKTTSYLSNSRTNENTGSRKKTLDEFASKNDLLRDSLRIRFEKNFLESSYISQCRVVDSNELHATTSSTRYAEMLENHLKSLYKYHNMSDSLSQTNNELRAHIENLNKQPILMGDLDIAETEVNNRITNLGSEIVLSDLVKEFEKAPYAWRDIAVLHVVFNLVKRNYRSIYYQNEELDLKEFFDKAINTRSREAIVIKNPVKIDLDLVKDFKKVAKNIFANFAPKNSIHQEKDLILEFKDFVREKLKEVHSYGKEYNGYVFYRHINDYYADLRELYETRSDEAVMKLLIKNQDKIFNKRDNFENLGKFIYENIKEYDEIKEFIISQATNIEKLDLDVNLDELLSYFRNQDKPSDEYQNVFKQYRRIKKELNAKLKSQKETVIGIYEKIYEELYKKADELELERSLLPDKSNFVNRLNNLKSIEQLEIAELKAEEFRIDNLKKLENEKNERLARERGEEYKETIEFRLTKFTGDTLSTADEVDAFVDKLRNDLMVELGKNGKVFLS